MSLVTYAEALVTHARMSQEVQGRPAVLIGPIWKTYKFQNVDAKFSGWTPYAFIRLDLLRAHPDDVEGAQLVRVA